ncbi:MAG: isocitrate/isopropylmalate family dehydrogenase, partial [Bryobacteraceae bacterium]
ANPTALMLSSVMMLKHIGENEAAVRLQAAIKAVYAEAKHTTSDVGGGSSTSQFTDAVISRLA